ALKDDDTNVRNALPTEVHQELRGDETLFENGRPFRVKPGVVSLDDLANVIAQFGVREFTFRGIVRDDLVGVPAVRVLTVGTFIIGSLIVGAATVGSEPVGAVGDDNDSFATVAVDGFDDEVVVGADEFGRDVEVV